MLVYQRVWSYDSYGPLIVPTGSMYMVTWIPSTYPLYGNMDLALEHPDVFGKIKKHT